MSPAVPPPRGGTSAHAVGLRVALRFLGPCPNGPFLVVCQLNEHLLTDACFCRHPACPGPQHCAVILLVQGHMCLWICVFSIQRIPFTGGGRALPSWSLRLPPSAARGPHRPTDVRSGRWCAREGTWAGEGWRETQQRDRNGPCCFTTEQGVSFELERRPGPCQCGKRLPHT